MTEERLITLAEFSEQPFEYIDNFVKMFMRRYHGAGVNMKKTASDWETDFLKFNENSMRGRA